MPTIRTRSSMYERTVYTVYTRRGRRRKTGTNPPPHVLEFPSKFVKLGKETLPLKYTILVQTLGNKFYSSWSKSGPPPEVGQSPSSRREGSEESGASESVRVFFPKKKQQSKHSPPPPPIYPPTHPRVPMPVDIITKSHRGKVDQRPFLDGA